MPGWMMTSNIYHKPAYDDPIKAIQLQIITVPNRVSAFTILRGSGKWVQAYCAKHPANFKCQIFQELNDDVAFHFEDAVVKRA